MSKVLKDFFSVINTKSLIVIVAACASTYICRELGFHFNVPTDLISIAIVFPIVFSIHAAYNRREKALEHYANFKGSALFAMLTRIGLTKIKKRIVNIRN